MAARIRAHPSAGFTIIELFVVIAIMGVLATLAGVAMRNGSSRIEINNASRELTGMLAAAPLRAGGTGLSQYIVFWETSAAAGVYLMQREDNPVSPLPPPPAWNAVDVAAPASMKGQILQTLVLPRKVVAFGPHPSAAFVGNTFPKPFSAAGMVGTSGTGLLGGCTFCINASNGVIGALRFKPDGTMEMATGNNTMGGSVALVADPLAGEAGPPNPRLLVVSAPAGAFRLFQ